MRETPPASEVAAPPPAAERIPAGLRAAPRWALLAGAFLLLLAIAYPFYPDIRFYYVQIGILIFWYAMLSTAWTIMAGYGGMFSIGHAAFVGVGAYTSTLLFINFEISPWLAMPIGMVLAAALAVVIGYPSFRFGLRGDYFALITIAFGQIMLELATGMSGVTGGGQGLPIRVLGDRPELFQFTDRIWYYFIVMGMWAITITIVYRLRRSHFGYQLMAIRDDEAAAARAGIAVSRVKLIAFALSAAICAAGGTFYAQFFLFIEPPAVLGINLSILIIVMAVLGGMGSFLGATLGAAILVPAAQFLSGALARTAGADLAVYGVILLLLMLFMPYGILGSLRNSPRWRRVIGW
jgi:branched-chain amino acid transport system permease protein